MICTSFDDPIQAMWDRYRKIEKENLGKKKKTDWIYFLPGSKFCKAEGHLSMRSCLQDVVINYSPMIIKYINKLELYRQFPPRRVKDIKIYVIENTSCVRNVMRVTPVSEI